ncbi:MAG: hypothetical protein CFE43_13125 [Burkholderiales bacterium PBB3]|nr:MAG: hypothetical protein CFE43_13125 [Burkholderiales bacterium PBB3]
MATESVPSLSRRRWLAGLAGVTWVSLSGCANDVVLIQPSPGSNPQLGAATTEPATGSSEPPPAPREFRAAWVATVANIDWPSRKGLSSAAQQEEVRTLLDRAVALKLNAIILQVRPCADALYPSELEPWSEYLSGVQGQAPVPFYDPLALWISEAHARGLELHAWFNPFRARQGDAKSAPSPLHVSQSRPQWVKAYGNQLWMDPGDSAAAAHSVAVMLDVLTRYDVDGIHMDDYFYPYPVTQGDEPKTEIDFPDQITWQRYVDGGGLLAREDWRRSNVDALVQHLNTRIHQIKPWVRFGISPFGIGRPDQRPAGIQGFSQYHKLYADVERWLQAGWLDYLVPQLYWPIEQKEQAFVPLLDYWHRQNTQGRHVWAGLFTSRVLAAPTPGVVGSKASWLPEEIARQISAVRMRAPGTGHVHFSMVALLQNRQGLADALKVDTYASPALVPASPWLESGAPLAPAAKVTPLIGPHGPLRVTLEVAAHSKAVQCWGVWLRYGSLWSFQISRAAAFTVQAQRDNVNEPTAILSAIVVSAIDRVGNESPRSLLDLRQIGL